MLTLEQFKEDAPWESHQAWFEKIGIADQIEGVRIYRLHSNADERGDLTVLFSQMDPNQQASPHVYLVKAVPGSIRAWVYHKRQSDRLAYTDGDFRVVLYDLRPGSVTYGIINILEVGEANKVVLVIPPYVIHGVQNRGTKEACFINMPSNVYDPCHPDKSRLPWDHPGIPYRFE